MTDDTMPLLDALLKRGEGDFTKELAEEVLGRLMAYDVEGQIGAGRYERNEERGGGGTDGGHDALDEPPEVAVQGADAAVDGYDPFLQRFHAAFEFPELDLVDVDPADLVPQALHRLLDAALPLHERAVLARHADDVDVVAGRRDSGLEVVQGGHH